MSKELVISATAHETRVAIVEDGQLCEIYVEREKEFALVGSIYKGRVTRVLPGMQSAFVDIGLDGDAFLYVSDFLEGIEDYDHIVTTVEEKVQKMEQQGGQVFTPGRDTPHEPPEVNGPAAAAPAAPAEQGPGPEPPAAVPPPARPPYERQGYRHEGRGDRDRGRGRGRGGRGRGGRWGRRGGRGGRGDRHGRELPPSKYASHRPYEPPPASDEPFEPIILPGESLAKYKDRIPAAPSFQPQQTESAASAETGSQQHEDTASAVRATETPSDWVTATERPAEETSRPESESRPAAETRSQEPEPEHAAAPESATPMTEPQPVAPPDVRPSASLERPAPRPWAPPTPEDRPLADQPQPASAGPAAAGREETEAPLNEDEASALAEQVAEAQQEEAEAAEESEEHDEHSEHHQGHEDESHAGEAGNHHPSDDAERDAAAGEGSSPEEHPEETAGNRDAEPRERVAWVRDESRARMQRPMRRGRGGRRRGGPPRRTERHVRAPHRGQSIAELLKAGQEIIVQIAKEPLGKKGARITSHIALPGRFVVYMPTLDHIGVSRKISTPEDRARLRRLLTELKGSFPGGFIVRTAAARATDEELRADVEFLGNLWAEIRGRAEQRKAPSLLHRDLNLIERILRDHLSADYSAIWVDNEEEFTKVVEFVNRFQPALVSRVKLYGKEAPIFEEFGIQQEIDRALRPKVWLKSGGYIVINHTEALVAIDVNTGKFVGKGSSRLEDTIVKTNLEAVKEIVRQIRLRDLGGIIVVDFIDMEERKNRQKVMQALEEALHQDKAPSKVLAFNEFGLVAITRKRTKQALERVLCQPCPYCTGSGMVKSVPTICYEIQAEARKMAPELDGVSLTLRVHPEIAKALKTRESALIDELEQWVRKSVIIQADPALHWEQYDIY